MSRLWRTDERTEDGRKVENRAVFCWTRNRNMKTETHNIIVKSFHNCFKLDMFWLLRPLTGNIYIHNFQGHLKCLIWTIDNPNQMQNMFCIGYLVLLIDVRCKEGWLPLAWYICASLLQLLQPIWWEPRLQKRRILMITNTMMSWSFMTILS